MNSNTLGSAQSALDARGLRDVKFFFSLDVQSKTNSDVAKEVAYVLNTYERGDRLQMEPFGDLTKK